MNCLQSRQFCLCERSKKAKPSWSGLVDLRNLKWMRNCASLSLVVTVSQCTPEQIDSFCYAYNKVIVEKGDSAIKAPLGVKQRLLANEKFYKEQCVTKE